MPKPEKFIVRCCHCNEEFTVVSPAEPYNDRPGPPVRIVEKEYKCPYCGEFGDVEWILKRTGGNVNDPTGSYSSSDK